MKLYPFFLFGAIVFLGGCAGYNTTMFSTKSNAGLDLDMKPPTAEISISRKEAVIEPAFENGKTPPVMASFKPRVGFGASFKNYFVGVDQTFAGGDAAKTMALLYDSPTPANPDFGKYDSTLTLTTPIAGSGGIFDPLFTPAAPGKIRPFIFGTDTLLGLKIAWSGVGGQFPDTVKAGFNRKEFAWAPILMSGDRKSVKMPSFLATIESNISGGTDTNAVGATNGMNQTAGIQSIQYFSTGEAAGGLAVQKSVRDAMLTSLDPNFSSKVSFHNAYILRNMLFAMYSTFQALSPQDTVSAGFVTKFNNLQGIDIPDSFQAAKPALFFYSYNTPAGGGSAVLNKNSKQAIPGMPSPAITSGLINAYISLLQQSITAIQSAQSTIMNGTSLQFTTDGKNSAAITPANTKELDDQLALQTQQVQKVSQQIAANQDILAAYDYFTRLIKQ